MRGLLADTWQEMLDRRVLWIFGILTVIGLLFIAMASAIDLTIEGQNIDVSEMGDIAKLALISGLNRFMWVMVFFAVLASAGAIPSMLVRGRSDYFLAQPISRERLLLSKLFALWVVYGLMMAIAMSVLFLATFLAQGFFDPLMLSIVLVQLVSFAIWLSITGLAGVAWGSTGLSMTVAFLLYLAQNLLSAHDLVGELVSSRAVIWTVDALYYIIPKTGQIHDLAGGLAKHEVVAWQPLWTSVLFALVMLLLALSVFRRKDF